MSDLFAEALGKLVRKEKQELISDIIEKLSFICYNMENRNWEAIDKLIEEYKGEL